MSHYVFASTAIFVVRGLNLHLPASIAFETASHSAVQISSSVLAHKYSELIFLSHWNYNTYIFLSLGHTFAQKFFKFRKTWHKKGERISPSTCCLCNEVADRPHPDPRTLKSLTSLYSVWMLSLATCHTIISRKVLFIASLFEEHTVLVKWDLITGVLMKNYYEELYKAWKTMHGK